MILLQRYQESQQPQSGESSEADFKKTKPTRKPGLTQIMRDARFTWFKANEHTNWKAVIWLDEAVVVMSDRRGGYRVWRRPVKHMSNL